MVELIITSLVALALLKNISGLMKLSNKIVKTGIDVSNKVVKTTGQTVIDMTDDILKDINIKEEEEEEE